LLDSFEPTKEGERRYKRRKKETRLGSHHEEGSVRLSGGTNEGNCRWTYRGKEPLNKKEKEVCKLDLHGGLLNTVPWAKGGEV